MIKIHAYNDKDPSLKWQRSKFTKIKIQVYYDLKIQVNNDKYPSLQWQRSKFTMIKIQV